MANPKHGAKGYELEELLRAYYLRAGFYVLRGVPLRFDGEDATDVDLWLYERPTGTARRRQIVDAKFKARPKAFERILWTIGLAEALEVDNAYVATTDKRKSLRKIARRLGLSLIDGSDIDRIQSSSAVRFEDRMTEEEFLAEVRKFDAVHRTKNYTQSLIDLKACVLDEFGAPLVNIALEQFNIFARLAVTSHQGSDAAVTAGRLAFLSGSIAAIALDFVSSEEPFRTADEKRKMFMNALRYGSSDEDEGPERIRMAVALARQYASNGSATAAQIDAGISEALDAIPAEIIADQAVKMSREGDLFKAARRLEHSAYSKLAPSFDELELDDKAFVGALLDFSDVERSKFASSWRGQPLSATIEHSQNLNSDADAGPLFSK